MAKECIRCNGYWVCGDDPTCNGESMSAGTAGMTSQTLMSEGGGSTTMADTKAKHWDVLGAIDIQTTGRYEISTARGPKGLCEVRIDGPK